MKPGPRLAELNCFRSGVIEEFKVVLTQAAIRTRLVDVERKEASDARLLQQDPQCQHDTKIF